MTAPARHALILADGGGADPAALEAAWPGWADGIDWVVAADGGARYAGPLGRTLDLWVGDGDSVGEAALEDLARSGVPVRRSPEAKDETDTELAILAAMAVGAARISIVGALGGARFDHALANVWLLALPGLEGRDVRIVDGATRIRLVGPGDADLGGRVGDLVSLLPFGGAAGGIETSGLRFPLRDESLPLGPARGLSNVRASADASVRLGSGRLLVVETPATLSR